MDDAMVVGLPRPRSNGLPVPWTTPVRADVVQWSELDTPLLLQCQTEWRCQVCGTPLPQRAWVVLDAQQLVVSDAAMHYACMVIAFRSCPALRRTSTHEPVEIDRQDIRADGEPLDSYAPATDDDEFGGYGDEVRSWTVAHRSIPVS
ncbi:hypothetical protein [Nocardia africana]|nr:hypothetical protein [Nocardia africana]